ncbi:MFS transporter M6 [Paramyrothecium foliicola]|nr:MFS transporter M6 [Paramyrothecium foliicola]
MPEDRPNSPRDGNSNDEGAVSELSIYSQDTTHTQTPEANTVAHPENTSERPGYSIYKPWQKRLIVAGATMCLMVNPFATQMYMPALNVLAKKFGVTPSEINLTVTTYMIFQGVVPALFSGLTDALGRRPGYIASFIVFISANIALALVTKYSAILVIRCFQSAGGAMIVILCQSSVVDIITSAERGNYVSITALPAILGPSLGPVLGGVLSKFLGWRSIFWFLIIYSSIAFVVLLVFLPETCRQIVGDGSIRPPRLYRTVLQALSSQKTSPQSLGGVERKEDKVMSREVTGLSKVGRQLLSFAILLRDIECLLLVLAGGIVYAGVYAVATSVPNILYTSHGFNDFQIGLVYLPMAGGSILAIGLVGPGMNWNFRRHAKKLGMTVERNRASDLSNFPVEQARLQIALPFLLLGVATMLGFGFATAHDAHVAYLCVIIFFYGISLVGVNNTMQVLIGDIFPEKAGAALAAYYCVKCLLGAAASGGIKPLIDAIGLMYAFLVFSILYLAMVPVLALVMRKGLIWRKRRCKIG